MERDLVGDVKRTLARGPEDFDEMFPGVTERFAAALAGGYAGLLDTYSRFAQEPIRSRRRGVRDQYSVGWYLLWDACNGLLGSFMLLQRGFETEPLAACRIAVERVAVALVLVDNPHLVDPYMEGREPRLATRSIAPASKVIPDLGEMWRELSNIGSHASPDNIGTGVASKKGQPLQMAIGGRLSPALGFSHGAEFFTEIAERLLAKAPEGIFFNERRARAELSKKGTRKAQRRGKRA